MILSHSGLYQYLSLPYKIHLARSINALLVWHTNLCDWKGRNDGKPEIEAEGEGKNG
jgi:hypothetical protein